MKVFVTGSSGFIGAMLVPVLLERGHEVTTLDTGYYEEGLLYGDGSEVTPPDLHKDIRNIEAADLEGHDAVVHLAELSNDPLGQHNEEITYEINHKGTVRLATLCKKAGIQRFVYTSSCSVYGIQNGEEFKTESSETNPQTAYARCKVMVERDLSAMADEAFSPTFLRNATAYGASPRIRFDIVLNNLAGLAWTTNEIKMTSDGMPWRPLVHVLDICDAIACTLEAPRDVVHNEVFNVGASKENYQVRDIARQVAEAFPGCVVTFGDSDGDNRSYRVRFEKIEEKLPGFRCSRTVQDGAEELRQIFEQIALSDDTFRFRAFTRLKQLQHLLETQQLDANLYWKN
jgi:nucleoside-diphosphate-sugar epimerase